MLIFHMRFSRSLAACEGALLVVDGSQGVEAQTLSTCYKAIDLGLEVIPVINKIDLHRKLNEERVKKEIEEIIGIDASEALSVSAKDGTNLNELMKQIAQKFLLKKSEEANLQALIIDSWYDNFLGVISLIKFLAVL